MKYCSDLSTMKQQKRLPSFLAEADVLTEKMKAEQLRLVIHEIARTYPEDKRDLFLQILQSTENPRDSEKDAFLPDTKPLAPELSAVMSKLKKIDNGDIMLNSEYNETWDDWYDSEKDEFNFTDPKHLLDDIRDAMMLVHKCIDTESYEDGKKLAEMLSCLNISIEGDYCEYGDDGFAIRNLVDYELLFYDYDAFLNECFYLAYMGSDLKGRADTLYRMLTNFDCSSFRLETLMQMGSTDLPDFAESLRLWIEHLGTKTGNRDAKLLKEAQALLPDTSDALENARKYADVHPSLYLEYMKQHAASEDDSALLKIGEEALDRIPVDFVTRSDTALLTAQYAEKLHKSKLADNCRFEAFRSDPSVINYLRLRFVGDGFKKNHTKIRDIIHKEHLKQNLDSCKGYSHLYVDSEYRKVNLSSKEYCTLLFLEQEFDQMKKEGMNVQEPLGWSSTFMKEGIAFMLLLLNRAPDLNEGLHSMLLKVTESCGFSSEKYFSGTGRTSEQNDISLFKKLLDEWKESVHLPKRQRESWIKDIDKWISLRTHGIMEANRRNYYGECAAFIAALGEVLESTGDKWAKDRLMEKYRAEYPRRSAFHGELRKYGAHLHKK